MYSLISHELRRWNVGGRLYCEACLGGPGSCRCYYRQSDSNISVVQWCVLMMVVIIEFELRAHAGSQFETALKQMQEQVKEYDGFLGDTPCCSLNDEKRFLTLSYWRDRESIKAWRDDSQHKKVQQLGRSEIMAWYKIRVCELEREYAWEWSG